MIGIVNPVSAALGMVVIDKVGRKTLQAIGSVGMAMCLAIAGLSLGHVLPSHLVLWVLIGFIAFFAFFAPSTGAMIWVHIAEVFPTPVRSRGNSVGASTHRGLNAVVATIFQTVASLRSACPSTASPR